MTCHGPIAGPAVSVLSSPVPKILISFFFFTPFMILEATQLLLVAAEESLETEP